MAHTWHMDGAIIKHSKWQSNKENQVSILYRENDLDNNKKVFVTASKNKNK